jgi:hypothetical protein
MVERAPEHLGSRSGRPGRPTLIDRLKCQPLDALEIRLDADARCALTRKYVRKRSSASTAATVANPAADMREAIDVATQDEGGQLATRGC